MLNKEVSADRFSEFTAFLKQQSGIVINESKRYLVVSRLSTLMHEHKINDINELIASVVSGRNSLLARNAMDAMTTNETLWFRDNYPFDLLKSKIFPSFAPNKSVTIWSAACSSGQEPYSIAMTYKEYIDSHLSNRFSLRISATDLSPSMLNQCRDGKYDELTLSRGGLTPERRRRFFEDADQGQLRIKPEIKQLIQFQPHNLIDNRPIGSGFDIIFCRNVLIYFSAETKAKILQQFAASLSPGGILFLGASESIGTASQYFSLVRCSPGLYYQLKS